MTILAALLRRTAHGLPAPSALTCALLLSAAGVTAPRVAEHTLMPSPQTVHIGYFLTSVKPVLTIDSGDIVTLEAQRQSFRPSSTSRERFHATPCRNTSATSMAR